MAIKENKLESNVPGKFYVDDQCIDCGLCRATAGEFFGYDEDKGSATVIKQPASDDEIEMCEEALHQCAVGAIGDDGE